MRLHTRGFTLIEMLLAIAVSGVTLALVATSVQAVLRVASNVRVEETRSTILLRLDLQFRGDAHQATGIESAATNVSGGIDQLTMLCDDEVRIEYQIQDGTLHRRVSQHGSQIQRDSFRLGRHTQLQFEIGDATNGARTVGLLVLRMPTAASADRVPECVNPIRVALRHPARHAPVPEPNPK